MRALLYSDIHLEFGKFKNPCQSSTETYYDIVLLAGDIAPGKAGVAWAGQNFKNPYYVAGNHELYHRDFDEAYAALEKDAFAKHGVIFLQNRTVEGIIDYDGVAYEKYRVIGATLWTDFALDKSQVLGLIQIPKDYNDYNEITYKDGLLTPNKVLTEHMLSLLFIRDELAKPFDGKTIVMTHHAPSRHSINPKYARNTWNHLYASNLDELIWEYQPDLWVHGHTHDSFSYEIGNTKVRANPRGYVENGKPQNRRFDINYIVDF